MAELAEASFKASHTFECLVFESRLREIFLLKRFSLPLCHSGNLLISNRACKIENWKLSMVNCNVKIAHSKAVT